MQLPRSLARFNRKIVNPIQSRWAGQVRPWIILVHIGRRTGRTYRTPMLAWKRGDLLMIGILYGTESSWVRNVLAADGGEVIRAGQHYRLRNPHIENPVGRDELSMIGRLYTRLSGQALVAVLVPASKAGVHGVKGAT